MSRQSEERRSIAEDPLNKYESAMNAKTKTCQNQK